ncbi:MAG TPA: SpoIIE family protein phosphatase [Phycisphaerales bacterium]|nr:SpoIIE family protein phosphatase [Phycisphaerales bacterium]
MESPTQTSNTPSRTTPGTNPDAGPAQNAPRVAGDSPVPTPPNATLRDFVTDGSVAALCDELARVTGSPIWLRDQSGLCIIAEWSEPEGPGHAGEPWTLVSESRGRARAFAICRVVDDGSREIAALPLRIRAGLLGSIVVALPPADRHDASRAGASAPGSPPGASQPIRRALALLAQAVSEICEAQSNLSKRVRELDALYRLSSLLSSSAEPDELLQLALDLSIEVLGVDAGSIALVEGEGETPDLRIRASWGLSERWISATQPLTRDGELRAAAMRGDVIAIENLAADPRILDHERVREEQVVSLLSTGLMDQGRPIGLIRLYTRAPRVFTHAEGELLRAIADHSASALTTATLRKLRAQDERLGRQVRLAASVQRRMLPRSVPQVPPFEIAAHYAPSLELGGDFYDFLELGGHLGILIGDVAGKGVPAALLMASVRASIRAFAQDLYHIDEVLERTNAALVRDTLDHEFATVWYGVVDPQTLRLTYCGAGHDWPLLIRVPRDRAVEDSDVQRLTADGMALGIDPAQKYPKGMFQLAPGDVLVTFTDGLHDAINMEGRRFGGTRLRKTLVEVLRQEPGARPGRIVDHVLAALRQHAGLTGRTDDITLIVMRVGDRAGSGNMVGAI